MTNHNIPVQFEDLYGMFGMFEMFEMWNPLLTNPDISELTNLLFVSKGFHISSITNLDIPKGCYDLS